MSSVAKALVVLYIPSEGGLALYSLSYLLCWPAFICLFLLPHDSLHNRSLPSDHLSQHRQSLHLASSFLSNGHLHFTKLSYFKGLTIPFVWACFLLSSCRKAVIHLFHLGVGFLGFFKLFLKCICVLVLSCLGFVFFFLVHFLIFQKHKVNDS